MSHLVILKRFSLPLNANIAKANLHSVGIESFLTDEHTINMQWLYSDALGGVRLLVSEDDYAQAKGIIEQDFSNLLDDI